VSPIPRLAGALFVASLAAAAGSPAAAQGDADTREVMAYSLTLPKLKQLNDAFADLERQRAADPAYQALLRKRRELAALSEKEDPTEAEIERMEQLEEEIAEAETEEEGISLDESPSLSAMADRMAADPRVAGALRRANLPPREAATLLLAYFQAAFTAGLLESGDLTEIPEGVNAENVKFIRTNQAALAALTALRALGEQDEP
jgi:hypothetical protein